MLNHGKPMFNHATPPFFLTCFAFQLQLAQVQSQKADEEDGDFGSELAEQEVNSTLDAEEATVEIFPVIEPSRDGS